jgi:hypothetical protein
VAVLYDLNSLGTRLVGSFGSKCSIDLRFITFNQRERTKSDASPAVSNISTIFIRQALYCAVFNFAQNRAMELLGACIVLAIVLLVASIQYFNGWRSGHRAH